MISQNKSADLNNKFDSYEVYNSDYKKYISIIVKVFYKFVKTFQICFIAYIYGQLIENSCAQIKLLFISRYS